MTLISSAWLAAALILALDAPAPTAAQKPQPLHQQSLQQRVALKLSETGSGIRFGLVVAAEDGRELVSIAPESRFMPASNTKIFTTAAAFATLSGLDRPDLTGGASIWLDARRRGPPDVVLKGNGDARLSSAPDCVTNCLAALADSVAAKVRVVGDVVGDASLFPDERWSPGMSWNNLHTRYGTAATALSLDDNELALRVSPAAPGEPPKVDLLAYYQVDNRAVTIGSGTTKLEFDRLPGSKVVRLTGTIAAEAEPELLFLGIDDPAHYAAWRFKSLLEARGVRVIGDVASRYRPPDLIDGTGRNGASLAPPPEPKVLARLTPPALLEDLTLINKVSQNLHAELMLRRIGRQYGTGSIADGISVIRDMLVRAGVPRAAYDFSDGSGMSTYNRVAPRGLVALLRWIARQPWGAGWRATLPIGGVDGTLSKRFSGTALQGRIFAKTGTLNATNALSGYMVAASGRTLVFSAFANDVPEDGGGSKAIDGALQLIAAEQ